jgi:hypothetical protein
MRQFQYSRITTRTLERHLPACARALCVPLPQLQTAVLCPAIHYIGFAERGSIKERCSIKSQAPLHSTYKFSKQEALGQAVDRDINLRLGLRPLPVFPALSHHGAKPFARLQRRGFSPDLFPWLAGVLLGWTQDSMIASVQVKQAPEQMSHQEGPA